ncbi:acetylserotonin methytransferase-like protein [Neofusicoccum parvum]|nr:acetylserotonin methytransferase-like protein [Neofusicoccum parvum]
MHSIFPRYNPNLPLAQQHYRPTQQSPTHIPKDKISRKPYSPTFYVPHANVLRSGSAEEPYYTPKIELGALWDASNGKARPEAKRTYSLQMHCRKASPDSSPIDGETFVFGSSPIQPFYSLEQALADHAAGASGDPQACEVLISRNHPTQARPNPLPVAHLEIQTPPPHAPAPPPEIFYQHPERIPQATHITTIHPKLATLAALEAAAQSPRASTIATFDPTAESPEAAQLASEVVADCEARNACQLFYCPVSEPLMPPYEMNKTGTYELRHPTLGAFPVVVQGDIKKSLDASSKAASTPGGGGGTSNGQSARSTSPMGHIPTTVTLLNPFAAPRSAPQTPEQSSSLSPPTKRPTPQPLQTRTSSPNRPPTPAPDEVLARLSLHTAALTIDAAAIAALGTDKSSPHAHTPHPYLIDVAVSAVLAVLVAERRRAGDGLEVVVLPAGGGTPPPPPGQPPGQNTVYGGGQWPTGSTGSGGLMVFAGPPTAAARSSAWPGQKGAKAQIREKVRPLSWSWWFGGDATKEAEKRARREAKAERKARQGRKGVVDIELGNGPGGAQAVERGGAEGKGKGDGGERMHWTVELVLALLAFAFKAVVFVLGLVFKILGRLIVKLNKCAAKA